MRVTGSINQPSHYLDLLGHGAWKKWMSQEVSKWIYSSKWVTPYFDMGYIGVITHLLTIY